MEPISYLEQRIVEIQAKLQEIKSQIDELNSQYSVAQDDLEGYQRTLNAERRRNGVFPAEQVKLNIPRAQTSDSSKAEFARQFVRSHPHGVIPNQIYAAFIAAGIPIGKPYVYALVQRLRKQEAIKQKRGKWFPVSEEQLTVPLTNSAEGEHPILP